MVSVGVVNLYERAKEERDAPRIEEGRKRGGEKGGGERGGGEKEEGRRRERRGGDWI